MLEEREAEPLKGGGEGRRATERPPKRTWRKNKQTGEVPQGQQERSQRGEAYCR